MEYKAGDEVDWHGRTYTLLERMFITQGKPMWMAIETNNPAAQMRMLIEDDLG